MAKILLSNLKVKGRYNDNDYMFDTDYSIHFKHYPSLYQQDYPAHSMYIDPKNLQNQEISATLNIEALLVILNKYRAYVIDAADDLVFADAIEALNDR